MDNTDVRHSKECGYIHLWRNILNSSLWTMKDTDVRLFITLLVMANWEDKRWWSASLQKDIIINRGELITSGANLASAARVSVSSTYRGLKRLEQSGKIKVRKTNKQFTFVSVCNYDFYNDVENEGAKRLQNACETPAKRVQTTKALKNISIKEEDKKEFSPSDFQSKKNEIQNPFSELPYNQPRLTRDPGYMEIILMQQDILDAGKVMTEDEALAINAAKVWAVYKLAVRGGMKFRPAEEAITGYLLSDLSVQELQDQITKSKVPANAPIWNVLKPLQEKATQRAATKVEEAKLRVQKKEQKERQRELEQRNVEETKKQNEADKARWIKEHPGQEFPGFEYPEYIEWLCPDIPKGEIDRYARIMSKGDPSSKRGKTKKIGQVVTELIDTGPPVKG